LRPDLGHVPGGLVTSGSRAQRCVASANRSRVRGPQASVHVNVVVRVSAEPRGLSAAKPRYSSRKAVTIWRAQSRPSPTPSGRASRLFCGPLGRVRRGANQLAGPIRSRLVRADGVSPSRFPALRIDGQVRHRPVPRPRESHDPLRVEVVGRKNSPRLTHATPRSRREPRLRRSRRPRRLAVVFRKRKRNLPAVSSAGGPQPKVESSAEPHRA